MGGIEPPSVNPLPEGATCLVYILFNPRPANRQAGTLGGLSNFLASQPWASLDAILWEIMPDLSAQARPRSDSTQQVIKLRERKSRRLRL